MPRSTTSSPRTQDAAALSAVASPEPLDGADPFLAAARILSRGGALETRLDGLAAQAAAMGGGPSAVVYLLDGEQGLFLPAGSAGLGDDAVAGLSTLRLPEDGTPADELSRAVQARRPTVVSGEPDLGTAFLAGPLPAAMAVLPLVTEDEAGAQAVQGLLVVGLAEHPKDPAPLLGRLGALADLTAAAVHQARLERALTERSEWLERVAHVDPLTGLTNRRTFERMLEHELARAGRQGTALSLAIFDIDGLAGIDRDHGADTADQVLRRVAATLADSVRLVDTVARLGGDEFALLAPGAAGQTIADRVTAAVAAADSGDEDRVGVRLSVGIATFPNDGATGDELLEAAEVALRGAKRRGPGQASGPAEA